MHGAELGMIMEMKCERLQKPYSLQPARIYEMGVKNNERAERVCLQEV